MTRTLYLTGLALILLTGVLQAEDGSQLLAADGASLLRRALGRGSATVISRLIEHHPGLVNHVYEDGLSPLHVAVLQRNAVAVRLLLERRADVNRQLEAAAFHDRDMEGATALHLAVRVNQPLIVRTLAAAGAQRNLRDGLGRTPFALARILGYRETISELRRQGAASFEDHLRAVGDGDLEMVRADLAAHPGYLRLRDKNGLRAVEHAIRLGKEEIVSALLSAGLGPDDRDRLGNTLLHLACWEGQSGIARRLISHGFPVDAEANGVTPLHIAAAEGRTECVKVLIAAGADPAAEAGDGQTPLMLARLRGHTAAAELIADSVRRKTVR